MEEILELLKTKGKCCVSGEPMIDSENMNMVSTKYRVKWLFPRAGNFSTGTDGFAMAVIHDKYVDIEKNELKGEIKQVIEISNGELIYHDVTTLSVNVNPSEN